MLFNMILGNYNVIGLLCVMGLGLVCCMCWIKGLGCIMYRKSQLWGLGWLIGEV